MVNNCKGKSASSHIYRIAIAGCIYHVWKERNLRLFQGKSTSVEGIVRTVIQEIFYLGSLKSKIKLENLNFYPS